MQRNVALYKQIFGISKNETHEVGLANSLHTTGEGSWSMKKVVEGKRYDTKTATEVASDGYSYPGDYKYWEETLYRTKSGRYFLHGKGGADTEWGNQVGQNERCDGQNIVVMTPGEALEWLENSGKDVPKGCPEIEALVEEG
jgi:hypothetical protein